MIIVSVILFWNELRSLTSIKQVDNYGMFQMTYYGDYGFDEFDRYDKVKSVIDANGGKLNKEQAIALLAEVGVINNGVDKLQWSVVYNLSALNGTIFAHRNTANLTGFQLSS